MMLPAHHRPGGGFINPWEPGRTHGFLDFLKWTLLEKRKAPEGGRAVRATFPRADPSFVFPRPEPLQLTVTWIGHSSFLLQIGGLNVLLDPIWSDRASPLRFAGPRRRVPAAVEFDAMPPIDAVVVSHDHYDHLDAMTVRRLIERYPAIAWLAPLGVGEFLRRRGARTVAECDWWEKSVVGQLELTCVPAQHFSGRALNNRNSTLWCGWAIRSAHHSVLFAGDTALHPEFGLISDRCGPFDVAILPIGAYEPRWFMGAVHMNPEDCMIAMEQVRGSGSARRLVLVGAHWGTFKLTDEPIDEPPARMRDIWRAGGLAEDDLWVMQHGETRALP
ncbi:MAG TPA: MBL fold metallo-hydrolase [Gemmatimonadaceae bacterium]|nr:MBL fold metallo-hydrolase [Gemmatimonadaceae bacterium]